MHNSINVSPNSLKTFPDHLNIDPKLYAKYQNPSSGGSQDRVDKVFLFVIADVEIGAELNILWNLYKS